MPTCTMFVNNDFGACVTFYKETHSRLSGIAELSDLCNGV